MDVNFELSQQLQGHDSQVRCLALLSDGTLVSGGLDAQVIMWRRPSPEEGFALHKKLGHHSDFIYSLAPSSDAAAFYSASKDKTAVRVDTEGNPIMQYVGHEGPVCSVLERGAQLVTGSWDGTAKVWDVATGEIQHSLDAGAHAVTVGILPTGEIVTGSQDRTLRVFKGAECAHKIDEAHADIIRGISVSSTHLLTASNDNLLKMWSFDGCEMAKLEGHSSFVYGVAHSHDNKKVYSSSDDSTLKVWSIEDLKCQQSIVHAGTVWQGASIPNGDVATACADMVVRVWTQNPDRMAPEAERTTQSEVAQQANVAASQKGSTSTPMDIATDISKMPTTVGKKNGEIKCFKEGSIVYAFSWNEGARTWDKIGVVEGAQTEKAFYAGDHVFAKGEYDFVWDVDMGAANGTKKLPFNKGQNPMAVAEAFIAREQINKENMHQIREFIMQNAGEANCGGNPVGAPSQEASAPQEETASSFFPLQTHLTFKDGKFDPLLKKLLEFNGEVLDHLRLQGQDIEYLKSAVEKLKSGAVRTELRPVEKEVIHEKIASWPNDRLFPVMDLWRLYLIHPQSCDYFKGSDRGAPFIIKVTGLWASDINGPLGLCCARYIANLFHYQTNRYAAFDKRDLIIKTLQPALSSSNKHTRTASITILCNITIVLHEISFPPKQWDQDTAAQVAQLLIGFISSAGADDKDGKERAIYAIGSLLPRDKDNGSRITAMCKDAGLASKAKTIEQEVGAALSPAVTELCKLLA